MDSSPSTSVISSPEMVRVPWKVSHESRDAVNDTSSADDPMLVVDAEQTDASAEVTALVTHPTKVKTQTATLVAIELTVLFPRLRTHYPFAGRMLFIRKMCFFSSLKGSGGGHSPTRLTHNGDHSAIQENGFALAKPLKPFQQHSLRL